MTKVYTYFSSDYAGIDFEGGSFYYGYEHTDENDAWCFLANTSMGELKVSSLELHTDQFDVTASLMAGVGHFMESQVKYIEQLEARIKELEFIVDNGLGYEDMQDDVTEQSLR